MTKSDDRRVPTLRFKGFTDEWEQRKLENLTKRISRKNSNLDSTLPLTISAQYGLVDQRKFFDKQIASKKLENYLLLKNGEFAYNKSYSKDYPFGAIKRLNSYKSGALSTLYIAFKPVSVNTDYLEEYFDSTKWYKEIYERATEGARNHGLLNISPQDFFELNLSIPNNEIEQERISKILKLFSWLITLQQRKVNDYFQYKTQLINTIFANKNWQIIKLRDVLSVPKEELAKVTTKSQIMTVKLNLGGIINGANRDTLNLSATKYYIRHAGQFIFGKQNFFNGSMAIIPKAMDGKVTSQDVPALNINNEKINSKFLLYYLSRRNFYKHTERFATGTGSKRLHVDTLLNFKIRIPDISYQNQIVSTLTLLDKKLQLETAKLNKLKQLKQFLLQNMFI